MKILADATLPNIKAFFKKPFQLTLYDHDQQVSSLLTDNDILLCRSTLKVTADLLANTAIQCVATASSGTDHIDVEYLKSHHITLVDAKGSNARAVADYVVASIAFLQQRGQLHGMRAGVIGVGEVGSRVVSRLQAIGFDVICFDPLKASCDPHFVTCELQQLTTCDLICVHANLHDTMPFPSKHLLDLDLLQQLKTHVVIINASRGGVVDELALLSLHQSITYCTDVYCNEPSINAQLVDYATLCTPHIAGHTIEAKQAAVIQVSDALHQLYHVPMVSTNSLTARKGEGPCQALQSGRQAIAPNWQEIVLSLYNPLEDTQLLKSALDKKQAFLTQRTAHTNRHDFNVYEMEPLDEETRRITGIF